MKKLIVTLLMCSVLMCGCGGQSEEEKTDSKIQNTQEIPESVDESTTQLDSIDGFEKAEYEKFNSYAYENGLDGTLIYTEGKVLSQTKIADSDPPILSIVIEQEDGNRWNVCVISDSKLDEIQDEEIRVFGTYSGFSDAINLPSMNVIQSDGEETGYDRIGIELKKDNQYVTVWSWAEYVKAELNKMNESEESEDLNKDTNNKADEECSQKDVEASVPTTGEKNALRAAQNHLSSMPFSYNGLVKQLEFEQYSHNEAVYAADNCQADWNEQAEKSAKNYMELMSFSRDGLIEQLEFDGFSHEQAVYGVEQNGY